MAKKWIKGFSLFLIVVFTFLSASSLLVGGAEFGAPNSIAANRSAMKSASPYRDLKVYAGGIPFGVKFITEGVLIVGFSDVKTEAGVTNPAKAAGLQCNDVILQLNGNKLTSAAELSEIVERSAGAPLSLVYTRGGQERTATLTPVLSQTDHRYATGIYVRDSGAGIGTVTFILPKTGAFAGLGHGICDSQTGNLIPMERGSVVDVTINGVVRGLSGSPGEVKGYFSSGKTGTLLGNTDCGVYGVFASLPDRLSRTLVSVGLRHELKEGKATLACTLDDNTVRYYDIQISDIHRDSTTNKCFTVKITDPALLEKTGGIIQGMSGSPIFQNGKIVGAVTHVLINDPTTGYGIFIENMLNQMGDLAG